MNPIPKTTIIQETIVLDFNNCNDESSNKQEIFNILKKYTNDDIKTIRIMNYIGNQLSIYSNLEFIFTSCNINTLDLLSVPTKNIAIIQNSEINSVKSNRNVHIYKSLIKSIEISIPKFQLSGIVINSSLIGRITIYGSSELFKIHKSTIKQGSFKNADFNVLEIENCLKDLNYDSFNVNKNVYIKNCSLKSLSFNQKIPLISFSIEHSSVKYISPIPDTKCLYITGNVKFISFKNLLSLEKLIIMDSNLSNDCPLNNLKEIIISNSPNLKPNLFKSCEMLFLNNNTINHFKGTVNNLTYDAKETYYPYLLIENIQKFKGLNINTTKIEIKNNIETSFENSKITKLICENLINLENTFVDNLISSKKRNLEFCSNCYKFKANSTITFLENMINKPKKYMTKTDSYEKIKPCENCNFLLEHVVLK